VVMTQLYGTAHPGVGRIRTPPACPDVAGPATLAAPIILVVNQARLRGDLVLTKVFPIKLKDGAQAKAEAVIREYAPQGPGAEDGTLSFRVYRDPAKPDYLLFVEHFADQAAYDAHTGSPAYRDMIAGRFSDLVVDFVEIDHELLVAL
jgi:quinol monooxygenase YgiN